MNRTQLMELVERCKGDKDLVKQELEKYFDTPEGQAVLRNASRSMLYTQGAEGVQAHQTTKELVVKLLLQEVD